MEKLLIFVLLMLIGTSMQAPKPLTFKDEPIEDRHEVDQTSAKDDITNGPVSSSIDESDQDRHFQSSGDNSQENSENDSVDDEDDDSVASFIKKSSVSRSSKTAPDATDSVASYISLDDQHNGAVRAEIPASNGAPSMEYDSVASYIPLEDQDSGSLRNNIPLRNDGQDHDNDDESSSIFDSSTTDVEGDSVASYINQEIGAAKDTINKPKKFEGDSVSSYIEMDQGVPRHSIPEYRDTNEPVSPSSNTNNQDSVGEYIGLEDNESISASGSGEDLEASGESDSEDEHERKTQEIIQGLEDISSEQKRKVNNKKMNELNPDIIVPHQMMSELWLDRSDFPTASPSNESSLSDQQQVYNSLPSMNTRPQYSYVDILQANKKGAVCLDGSTPGFFYRQGLNSGQKKWIIYLQGGAWCPTKDECYERSKSNLGSSLKFNKLINAEGILSRNPYTNPNFHNWNVVYLPYCDGASYTGNRTKPLKYKGRMIYFRGKRILSALMDDLLGAYGMNEAEKVVFSGTSAGGLAVLLHSDYVRSRIPSKVGVYPLADAGIFLNVNNLEKEDQFGHLMSKVYKLHGSSKSIKHECVSDQGKKNGWKCLFPYYFGKYIHSPIFIVNPLYDSWQLGNVVGIHCTTNLYKCTPTERRAIIEFRKRTLEALVPLMKHPKITLFADGCFDHGQITFAQKWNDIRVRNRSMSGSFVRWMMNQENLRAIVDPEMKHDLFNPTCVSHQIKIDKKSFVKG